MKCKFLEPMPKVFAHRGDSHNYPENTLEAFNSAIEMKVDVIETDVHLTKDDKIVIWHDDTLDRNTNGSGKVTDHTLDELKKLDAGFTFTKDGGKTFPFRDKGIQLATFEEALITCPNQRFNVDLKTKSLTLVDKFYELLEKHNAFDRVCVSSFHTINLEQMRQRHSKVTTSASFKEVLSSVIKNKFGMSFKKGDGLMMQMPAKTKLLTTITPSYVKMMHENNHILQIWTINEETEMRRLLKMGVDAIMTDNPELLIKVLNTL